MSNLDPFKKRNEAKQNLHVVRNVWQMKERYAINERVFASLDGAHRELLQGGDYLGARRAVAHQPRAQDALPAQNARANANGLTLT